MRLILASASPRRADLLRAAGFAFEIVPADVDESVRPGEAAAAYVQRVAADKASRAQAAVGEPPPDGTTRVLVLGADTAVVVDGAVLGKPRDAIDARDMLRRLSGRAHDVMTGVAIRGGTRWASAVETTAVRFAPLSDREIDWYLESGEGADKAGGYAIQGLASRFIPHIAGSYSNVVGLPVATVYRLIEEFGPATAFLASQG